MKELDVAIDWLSKKGYKAAHREWTLGKCVVAYTDVLILENGIRVLLDMFYLYQHSGHWKITNFTPSGEMDQQNEAGSLDEALVLLSECLERHRYERENA